VTIDGADISTFSSNKLADFRNQNLGFVFQTFNLIPVLTAYENVEFSLLLKSNGNSSLVKKKVEAIMERVGLTDQLRKKPLEMSGGQQQRVAIARALVKEPRLVLADEPTANLDSETAADILLLMQNLNREEGVTFIFSTHDRMVMDFANRLIILKDGKIASDKKQKR
jgi:putative ABC transport system ATP-binding protein